MSKTTFNNVLITLLSIAGAYLVCFILLVLSLRVGNALSKDEIINVVNDNQDLLSQTTVDIDKPNFELSFELKFKGVQRAWVNEESEKYCAHIEFFCGGKGMDDYYGFYYVEDDTPIGWEGEKYKLIQSGAGWRDEWDEYYTERIRENWFYYEMHF